MEPRKSTTELRSEAEEAHIQAERLIGLGEDILDKARELKEELATRIRHLAVDSFPTREGSEA